MFYLNFRRERDRYDRDRERDKQRERDRERGRDDRDRRAAGRGGAEKRELVDTDDIGNETLERLKKRRMELEADEVNFPTFRTFCSFYHTFCFRPTPNSIPAE